MPRSSNCVQGPAARVDAEAGHVDIARFLVEREASKDQQDDGSTALHCAAEDGYREGVRLLVESGAD